MTTTNKETVQKVNDAFNEGDIATFLEYCTEDVQWNMVGMNAITGKEAIRNFMSEGEGQAPPQIVVEHTIGEEDMVVSTGTFKMNGKNGEPQEHAYCDVYRFAGDKIQEMNSYIVKLRPQA